MLVPFNEIISIFDYKADVLLNENGFMSKLSLDTGLSEISTMSLQIYYKTKSKEKVESDEKLIFLINRLFRLYIDGKYQIKGGSDAVINLLLNNFILKE